MNRITRMKALRRGTVVAATVAALVASGAAIAGASGTGVGINARGALELTHTHHADHDHGHHGIHQVEGVITSLVGPVGSPTSMIMTTRENTSVTVMLTTSTKVMMKHASGTLTLANLAAGERVSVTPVPGSTLASFTAASVKIQVPEIHHIEGVVSSVNGAASMVVTTPDSGQVTVNFTSSTAVTMEHASGALTLANLVAGEHVSVTPSSTSTPGNFVAAAIQIQVPEIRHIEGVIGTITTTNGIVASMVVNTGHSGTVTVNFAPSTVITMEHASGPMTPANLVAGERVNVTPSSTSTPGNFVAASVRVQATEIHPIEGVVSSVNGATSMVVTNRDRGSITVYFTSMTSVVTNHTPALITSTSVAQGERVSVTPSSTSTPTSFVAASVRIQRQDK